MTSPRPPSLKQPIRTSDIHGLSVFRSVVECNGVSPAATKLNLDVSTISRQLKDIEIRIGMRLCERGRGGFSLTAEGEAVYQLSCDLLRTIEEFQDRIDEIRNRAVGQLRIGAVNHVLTNAEIRLDRVVRRVHDNALELDVGYTVMPSREICRAVIDGRIHIGITADDREHPDLERSQIYVEEHRIYCGSGHPLFEKTNQRIERKTLQGYKYVARDHKSPTDSIAEELGMIRGVVANDIEAITLLLQSGLYLGYLPTHHVDALKEEGTLRPLDIDDTDCIVPIYLYHRKVSRKLSSVRLLLDEIEIALSH